MEILEKAQDRWVLDLTKCGSARQGAGASPVGTNKAADNGSEVAGQEIEYLIQGVCPTANVAL